MTDKVDHESFFKEWGESEVAVNQVFEGDMVGVYGVSLGEVYQAIKARLLAEVRVDITSIPLMTEHGDKVEQMFHGDRGRLIDGEDL